jgi:ABC-type branched-subunit amino acid transport system permease subunit
VKSLSELWVALREDAHFAYKSLGRVPTYTATVVLTLALAIGGLTAVFSVLYAIHARPTSFSTFRTRTTLSRKSPLIRRQV